MPEDMKWRLPDCWTVKHSDGQQARIDVVQNGNTLVGTAHGGSVDASAEMTGTVSGSVHGDTVTMTVSWPNSAVVEYHGTINGDGRVEGNIDRSDGAGTGWFGEQPLGPWE